jgi:FkbM family methyltransferase
MGILLKDVIKYFLTFSPKILFGAYSLYESIVALVLSKVFAYRLREIFINKVDSETQEVMHKTVSGVVRFKLHTPNSVCAMRHNSFSDKEPEMLEWIEEYGGKGALYDIGANIGIYSLYYAKSQPGNVYSFEPSAFNLRQLAKNVSANSLSNKITIISTPLSDKTGVSTFINSNVDEGGALNAFGVNYGHDGEPIHRRLVEYSVIGFSLDDLKKTGAINEPPSLIKIDVDGIEHLILSGATKTLSADTCKSVYIEVNDDFDEQSSNVRRLLETSGFTLKEKRHAKMFDNDVKIGHTYNQIWVKG